jgi:ATP-dependent DNA helicase RecQ
MAPHEAARIAVEAHDVLKQAQRERLATMQQYAEISTCRREFLLQYFGDEYQGPCGNCDNDAAAAQKNSDVGERREIA